MSKSNDSDRHATGDRRCEHRDCEPAKPAVAVYEGIVPPDGTIRYASCEDHAPKDTPPIEHLDAGDGNSKLVTDGGRQASEVYRA